MMQFGATLLPTIVSLIGAVSGARLWTRCEVAHELSLKHVPEDQIADWLCIADRGSSFNGSSVSRRFRHFGGGGYYGLFQVDDRYACARYGSICELASCDLLLDDELDDDIECMLKVHAAYVRELGDGFAAWPIYKTACQGEEGKSVEEVARSRKATFEHCLDEEVVRVQAYFKRKRAKAKTANLVQEKPVLGKVYERCELAVELRYRHRMPLEQIGTWVCIAYHESRFNTSAEGRLNADGSGDHGLFQISDIYWCSEDANRPGKACRVKCADMRDSDITDDVRCVKTIYEEHQRISGNGFHAWTVYKPYCEGREASFVHNCFDGETHPTTQNRPRPGIVAPTSPTIPKKSLEEAETGKVYDRCELANDLVHKFHLPREQVATWVCIAYHESRFNTSAEGRLNADGSGDHGLFQISDIYWCSPPGNGWACGVSCAALKDSDIADDVKCALTIFEEHQRLSGDGFNAWSVYKPYCQRDVATFVRGCFGEEVDLDRPVTVPRPVITAPPRTTSGPALRTSLGKVFDRCELAQELHLRQGVPLDQTANWVCIAKYQSNYNTSAIGYGPDGVQYHGMFQLSDEFWCSPPGRGWVCGLTCSQLRDGDISDDLACMRHIYEEHQRISGDGYNAWAVYQPYCRGKSATLLDGCFEEGENAIVPTPPTTRRPVAPPKNFPRGKVYKRCELAQELYYRHGLPYDQIATWVCIAHRESGYNVSAIGRLNADGSEDHGLFQISDIYWCSPPGKGWVCGLSCSDLEDNDLTDDVECMRTIYEEHTRLSGDGFNAWAVYRPYCKGRSDHYIDGCFEDPNDTTTTTTELTTVPTTVRSRTTRSRTSTTKLPRWSTVPTTRPTTARVRSSVSTQRQTASTTATTPRCTTSLYDFYLNSFGRRPAISTAMPVYTFKPFASRQRGTASTATESSTTALPPVVTTTRFSDFNRWFRDG